MRIPTPPPAASAAPEADGGAERSSATVATWTLVSRVTGLLRIVAVGAVLGPTFLANVFVSANSVPSLLYSLVAGPVLAMVVVPVLVRTQLDKGADAVAGLVRRLTGWLVGASALAAVALVALSPLLAWTLTTGVQDPMAHTRAVRLTMLALVIMAPQVILYTVAAIGAAAQQTRGRFALAAAAPALENVGLIITVAVVATVHTPGADLDVVPVSTVVLLAAGATLAVTLHAGTQAIGSARVGLPLRPSWNWRQDEVAMETATRLRRSVAVAVSPGGAYYALLAMSATVGGGVLVMQMAQAVYNLPAALGARAVSIVALPLLSDKARIGLRADFAASWRHALFLVLVVSLPPFAVLLAFSYPIAALLTHGELHTVPLIAALAACLAVLAPAQLANGLYEVGRQALFAMLDVRGPQIAGVVSLAVTIGWGGGALMLQPPESRLPWLAAAVLVADVAAASVVLCQLHWKIRPEPLLDTRRAALAVVASLSMVPVLGAGWWWHAIGGEGPLRALVAVALFGLLAIASYAGALALLLRRRGVPA